MASSVGGAAGGASDGLGRGGQSSVGDLLSAYLRDQEAAGNVSENRAASVAWWSANGDIEHAHTTGVFVRPARRRGLAPVICVYVDSKARSVDFRANRETYLARLDLAGRHYSDIEFLVSRYPARKAKPAENAPAPLPDLTAEELAECERLAAQVPEALRSAVHEAIVASFRRQKAQKG